MSIVIAAFDPKGESIFYADRKWARIFPNGETHSEGEIEKIYLIRDNVACGFTGIAKWGCGLAINLINSINCTISELIDMIKGCPYPKDSEGSTFILMGIYDDSCPFIFTYKTDGEFYFGQDQPVDILATSPESYLENCTSFFLENYELHEDLDRACINTIQFAAKQDPQRISETYDVIRIPYSIKE